MKMMTVPALPFKEESECSLPSASGSVKSGTTAPMAALASGAGPVARAACAANANESARRSATAESFFINLPELLYLEVNGECRQLSETGGKVQSRNRGRRAAGHGKNSHGWTGRTG